MKAQVNDDDCLSQLASSVRLNPTQDVFLKLFCNFKMGYFFFAITASIVQKLERLVYFALQRKQVHGELFMTHVYGVC